MTNFPSLVLSLGLFGAVNAAEVLYSYDSAKATAYYDLTNSLCGDLAAGDPFVQNWAELTGMNNATTYCEPHVGAISIRNHSTNSIMAINEDMVWADPAKWCGKEVQITTADGTPVTIDDGPLYIWDSCEACKHEPRVDLSAKAFVKAKGGSCAGDNPVGLKVNILDNDIVKWQEWYPNGPDGTGASNAGGTGAGAGAAGQGSPSPVAVVPSPSTPATGGGGTGSGGGQGGGQAGGPGGAASRTAQDLCPTKGQWQCSGTVLQQCNYVGLPAHLDWQVMNPTCGDCDTGKPSMCS